MKIHLKSIVVPAVSAIIGGTTVVTASKLSPEIMAKFKTPLASEQQPQTHSQPIADFTTMQNQMQKQMQNDFSQMQDEMKQFDSFDPLKFSPLKFSDINLGSAPQVGITKREDGHYVYYDIHLNHAKTMAINTKIENGYITITGTRKKVASSTNENKNGKVAQESYFNSTLVRTFPLPKNVYANKMTIIRNNGKIELRFPKMKA